MSLTITPPTVTEAQIILSDVTTDDVSTSKHGFAPRGSNNNYDFLNGIGGYSQPFNYSLMAYSLLGGVIKAEPLAGNISNVAINSALTDARVQFTVVYLPVAATITGVKWWQNVLGNYTGDAYNGVGLYSLSAGTMTLVASSANDAAIWQTAASNSLGSKAFSGTYAAAAGVYVIAFLYNQSAQTTAPRLGGYTATTDITVGAADFTNSVKLAGQLSAQTALPSPTQAMSGITGQTSMFYVALY